MNIQDAYKILLKNDSRKDISSDAVTFAVLGDATISCRHKTIFDDRTMTVFKPDMDQITSNDWEIKAYVKYSVPIWLDNYSPEPLLS
ncbi:MAG: hypothetical protein MUO82_00605, partial [Candidatus Thermoplasmatota archaeon]|nr:hypothetical protein [Candidatus Thermoplasmatota archaeon]